MLPYQVANFYLTVFRKDQMYRVYRVITRCRGRDRFFKYWFPQCLPISLIAPRT